MSTITTQKKQKVSFLRSVQQELKKVSWTSKQELYVCTKAVIIATFVFGFSIYFVDVMIRGVLGGLGNIVQRIFG